jgi:hypothetical protein
MSEEDKVINFEVKHHISELGREHHEGLCEMRRLSEAIQHHRLSQPQAEGRGAGCLTKKEALSRGAKRLISCPLCSAKAQRQFNRGKNDTG